jgi:hypothetical protein
MNLFTHALRSYAKLRRAALARQNPAEAQWRELRKLLARAADTRFGRDHGFRDIRTVSDYQRAVPLRRYEDFWRDYWERDFPVLKDVTWPGRIPFFAVTSGTTSGTSKNIPVTHAMNAANSRGALDVLLHHLAHNPRSRAVDGKSFFLGGSTALKELAPGVFAGDLSGIAFHEVPLWFKGLTFPPRAIARETDWDTKVTRIAELAPREDIRILGGTPAWLLNLIERQQALAGRPLVAADLYPRLELVLHGGVNFKPYRKRFEAFLGDKVELREVYPASEGFIASQDEKPEDGLRLMLDNGVFFEFVPVHELDNETPSRHTIETAQTGVNYAVVLTTCAGCWSYVLGDTVRFVSLEPPRILITGRTSYFMSAFGEHLIGEEIENAVTAAAAAVGLMVSDFSVGAKITNAGGEIGHHRYIVEVSRYPVSPGERTEFAEVLDAHLAGSNDDYKSEREAYAVIGPPDILFVPPGTFTLWMKSRGRLGGQNKVPRVLNDAGVLAGLETFAASRL